MASNDTFEVPTYRDWIMASRDLGSWRPIPVFWSTSRWRLRGAQVQSAAVLQGVKALGLSA
jgi:hypothetical protein